MLPNYQRDDERERAGGDGERKVGERGRGEGGGEVRERDKISLLTRIIACLYIR